MDLEKYYQKLPSNIKYNQRFFNISLRIARIKGKIVKSFSRKDDRLENQYELLNLILTQSNIKVEGSLRRTQLLYVELLKFIDNVCKKYSIEYWIDYGTLIGAIRHGGFVPWDDDIDLSMMREDYEKLIEVLPNEISRFKHLKENCGLSLLEDGGKNYFKEFKGTYDIEGKINKLVLVKYPLLQFAWMKPFVKIDFFPKDYLLEEKKEICESKFLLEKHRLYHELFEGKIRFYDELILRSEKLGLVKSKNNYISTGLDGSLLWTKPYIFKYNDIFPLKTIKFEGEDFYCPNNIHEVLATQYGEDYMKIPKNIQFHNLMPSIESQFDSNEQMNLEIENTIQYLKKINDEFWDVKK